ncbi:MAG: hypothetical protein N2Z21_05225 [Candidatus Sumerlaeaceae bacterium]|nr:hypothetical protein [Candidatus Sumerlaeaceae bacterium]
MKGILSTFAIVMAVCTLANTGTSSAEKDPRVALTEIRKAYEKVVGLQAEIETKHETADEEVVLTRSLLLSKQYGWKITEGIGKLRREIINDFSINYVYYPEQRRVLKLVARTPEVAAEFKKPVAELNPLFALDERSLRLKGVEELAGEKVYHFEGTTTTQFLQGGKPVTIRIEAWVGAEDGLPRKTIERWEDRTGTTIYKNLRLRDDITSADFQFQPPQGVTVVELGGAEDRKE